MKPINFLYTPFNFIPPFGRLRSMKDNGLDTFSKKKRYTDNDFSLNNTCFALKVFFSLFKDFKKIIGRKESSGVFPVISLVILLIVWKEILSNLLKERFLLWDSKGMETKIRKVVSNSKIIEEPQIINNTS